MKAVQALAYFKTQIEDIVLLMHTLALCNAVGRETQYFAFHFYEKIKTRLLTVCKHI